MKLKQQKKKNYLRLKINYNIYIGKYLQLKYTGIKPGKISICLNRGREESVGNDDVSIVCARKYQMVRMT